MSNESNYSDVTDIIVKAIESGDFFNFERPWIPTATLPLNYNNNYYSPMNTFILGCSTKENEYEGRNWLTANRVKMLKGFVDTDHQQPTSVFSNAMQWLTPEGKWYKGRQQSKKDVKRFLFIQTFLYNVDQVEWGGKFPKEYDHLPAPSNEAISKSSEFKIIHGSLDSYLGRHRIPVEYGNHGAAYSPSKDLVYMPKIDSFKDEVGYASVLAHEVVHSTGHKSRLDRNFKSIYVDKDAYSLEELVAELGSAMLLAKLNIKAAEHNDQSVAYIKGWLSVFKTNKKIIPIADAQAKKALHLIEKENTKEILKQIEDPAERMKALIKKTFVKSNYNDTRKW